MVLVEWKIILFIDVFVNVVVFCVGYLFVKLVIVLVCVLGWCVDVGWWSEKSDL